MANLGKTILNVYRRWDKHLLLNHPRLWALRLPLLVVYLVAGNGLALLISICIPLKINQIHAFHSWLWFVFVVEMLGLVLWWRIANRFSTAKSLERFSPFIGFTEMSLYILCVLVFLSPGILGSAIIEQRFSKLILATPIEADLLEIKDHKFDAIYPQDLVERYINLDYESYLASDESDVWGIRMFNMVIQMKLKSLYSVAIGQDDDWYGFLTAMILIINLSLVMFVSKHISADLQIHTLIYVVLLGVFLGLFEIGVFIVMYQFSIASIFDEIKYLISYTRVFLFLLSFGSIFVSLRGFWQKRYRVFTAVNITLMPFVVYCLQLLILDTLDKRHPITNYVFYFENLPSDWVGAYADQLIRILIFGTPIFILWVFIPLKRLYRRLLVLPKN